jgi:NAD(P)-dependent dehydrogenase (short-subunit alcohol dehydrogenase family)
VITGAGDGIGRALALRAARLGMRVAVLDIREDAAQDVVATCEASGGQAVAIACDVTDSHSLASASQQVEADLGPVSLLWANAGVLVAGGLISAPREQIQWLYSVNVDGIIDTVRAFAPRMMAGSGWRAVAITASMAGLAQMTSSGSAAYGASKYAVVGIAEALRPELAEAGIGVTLLCPGIVNTRIWDGARARPERLGGSEDAPEERGRLWRASGMDPDHLAEIALDCLCRGEFYVVTPTAGDGDHRIRDRSAALLQAVRPLG